MKRKFLCGAMLLGAIAFGVTSLSAATNRVKIISNSGGEKELGTDGTKIVNRIDESKTNLVDGKVAIEIAVDNSKDVTAYYAFNNDTNLATSKDALITKVKGLTDNLAQRSVKQALYFTNDDNISIKASTTGVVNYEDLTAAAASETTPAKLTALISGLKDMAKSSSDYIFLFTSTLPTLTDAEKTALATLVTEAKATGAQFVVYSIDSTTDDSILNDIFSSTNVIKIDSTSNGIDTIAFDTIVATGFMSAKKDVTTEIILDDHIIDNFEIKDLAVTKGTVTFDKDNKKIVASKVDLDANEDYKITYNLQIKSVVDSTKVDFKLRTSKQVNITLNNLGTDINGNFPATDKIDDDICSPVIQILKEAVDNPYTGVYSYVIAGSCMLAVALITLAVLNKKKYEL